MAPSEAFSTAANVLSVVGLADIVFKYGREVYETLSKVYNAPEEIKQLLGEVKDVEGHASRVKDFLTDLAQSTLQQLRKDLTSRIETLLLHFQEELVVINKSVTESTLSSSDGWLKKLRKNAKWVWDEQDITLARRRLERWKRELDSTLILAGRKIDVSIHAEVVSARSYMAQESSDTTAAFSDLRDSASSIENRVDGLSTTIGTFLQGNNSQLSSMRGVVLDTQEATKRIMNKLEEVNSNMMENFATMNLTRARGGAFTFEGSNLESMTLPLELLYSELVKTLPALQHNTELNVSQFEAGWIQQQFEMVRAASFEISANMARSRATHCPPTAIERNPWRKHIVMDSTSSYSFVRQKSSTPVTPVSHRSILYQSESLRTPFGTLNFSVIRSYGTYEDPGNTELESMAITFYPSEQFGLQGVSASFAHHHPFTRQHIPPVIRSWNIVPQNSAAFAAVARDDVSGLMRLFEVGAASPFDRTPDDYSLINEALNNQSYQTFKLLLEQGAGPYEIALAVRRFDAVRVVCSQNDANMLLRMIATIYAHVPKLFSDKLLSERLWSCIVLPNCKGSAT